MFVFSVVVLILSVLRIIAEPEEDLSSGRGDPSIGFSQNQTTEECDCVDWSLRKANVCKEGYIYHNKQCYYAWDTNKDQPTLPQDAEKVCKGLDERNNIANVDLLSVLTRHFDNLGHPAAFRLVGECCVCYSANELSIQVNYCPCDTPGYPLCSYPLEEHEIHVTVNDGIGKYSSICLMTQAKKESEAFVDDSSPEMSFDMNPDTISDRWHRKAGYKDETGRYKDYPDRPSWYQRCVLDAGVENCEELKGKWFFPKDDALPKCKGNYIYYNGECFFLWDPSLYAMATLEGEQAACSNVNPDNHVFRFPDRYDFGFLEQEYMYRMDPGYTLRVETEWGKCTCFYINDENQPTIQRECDCNKLAFPLCSYYPDTVTGYGGNGHGYEGVDNFNLHPETFEALNEGRFETPGVIECAPGSKGALCDEFNFEDRIKCNEDGKCEGDETH